MHLVNDLPGVLLQIRHLLRPDGLFIAALFGADSLAELRQAWYEADATVTGGVSPRVAPFAGLADVADLLTRAGFALPVADSDAIKITYGDPLRLMTDLKAMGESNPLADRRRVPTTRRLLATAAERHRALFAQQDGRVPAGFQILYLTAWAPDASQPNPLAPGSAAARLAEALDTREFNEDGDAL